MKTKITAAILAVVLSNTLFAQDIMTLKNGSELKVKVMEVAPTEIKYKKFDNLDGPTYSDLKSNIFMIKYGSGLKDVFTDQPKTSEQAEPQKKETSGATNSNYVSITNGNFPNVDFIVTSAGDTIHCVIDLITNTTISYHVFRQGMDTRTSIPMKNVSKYFNAAQSQKEIVTIVPVTKNINSESSDDEDEFLPEIRRYGGPRVGVTYVFDGAYKNVLMNEGKRNVYSQFGWQFEKRLFTTKTGISAVVEFVPMIGGIDMGKFIPSASALIGIRVKNGIEFGVGPTAAVYGGKNLRGDYATTGSVGIVIAAGFSVKSDKVYFPMNLAFIPSVGKKENYYDEAAGQMVSKQYQTGAKLSLLVGFNYRKR
ncbi:hypothetical protein BH10BAC1_BH10BAC1_11160 [soil metagenome]